MRKLTLAVLSALALTLSWVAPAASAAPPPSDAAPKRQAFAMTADGQMKVMDADSCNNPQWGVVCVNVNGSGLFVSRVTGSHPTATYTCDRAFHLWGYYENGQQWHRNGTAGCGIVRVWVDFDLNANMKDGSQICADLREGASQWHQNGFACITVHR
jgi:hypothetical protein